MIFENSTYFGNCTGLVNVTFEKGSRLTSITGDCVKDSGNRVTSYGAFLECTSLTKIEIPASVTTIGSGAFHDCSSLEIVSFEEGSKLITIKDGYKDGGNTVYGAFTNCDNLTLFDASNCTQIKTIGNYAFIMKKFFLQSFLHLRGFQSLSKAEFPIAFRFEFFSKVITVRE